MEIQPQLVLLQKTLLYIEGIGRQLYPQLDLWKTAKPFLEKWIKNQVGLPAFIRAVKIKAPFWAEKLPELPELFYEGLQQHRLITQRMEKLGQSICQQRSRHTQAKYLWNVGALSLIAGLALYWMQHSFTVANILLISIGFVSWLIGWSKTS